MNTLDKEQSFGQSLLITYVITVALIIVTIIMQYNTVVPFDYTFYRIKCPNYLIFALAKMAEGIVPTTITYVLTLFLTGYRANNNSIYETCLFVLLVLLGFVGVLFPSMKDYIGFWIVLVIIYVFAFALLYILKIITGLTKVERKGKTEKSDGHF